MSDLTYSRLLAELFPRVAGGIKWGLERTEHLLSIVGDPHRRFRSVHVAGTNGKGSVAALVGAALSAAGHRAAIYSSPHLCDFRERFLIDGRPLDEAAVLAAGRRLWPEIEATGATFFEATTALGFLALADAGAEVAVIEVGLGGRLDATNVIDPDVCVITNIGLDHTEFLGHTLASVAAEKAGIIKRGVPVVTAETAHIPLSVLEARARAVGAPWHVLPPDLPLDITIDSGGTAFRMPTAAWGELRLELQLVGRHQARNAALAISALERLPAGLRPDAAAVIAGIRGARWPGRFQVEVADGVTWVLDAAHNPAGAAALAGALACVRLPRPLVLLCGILADKDWSAMLPPLAALADAVVLTVPSSAAPHRRWDPYLATAACGGARVEVVPELGAAIERARRLAESRANAAQPSAGASSPGPPGASTAESGANVEQPSWPPGVAGRSAGAGGGTVVVAGSLHTVGDVLVALGRAPWALIPDFDTPLPLVTPAV